jgi:hypothetical protein
MNAHVPWQEQDIVIPEPTWMNSRWRQVMLIMVALNIPVMIYGVILIFKAAAKPGISALIGDNYANPVLWISGAVVAGHLILLIGAVGLLINKEWAIEGIKMGAGIVFVFQSFAIAIAIAFWIGMIFKIGQGRQMDPETEEPIVMSSKELKKLTINTFLPPRLFATTWLSIGQIITLMVAIEKDKKDK